MAYLVPSGHAPAEPPHSSACTGKYATSSLLVPYIVNDGVPSELKSVHDADELMNAVELWLSRQVQNSRPKRPTLVQESRFHVGSERSPRTVALDRTGVVL